MKLSQIPQWMIDCDPQYAKYRKKITPEPKEEPKEEPEEEIKQEPVKVKKTIKEKVEKLESASDLIARIVGISKWSAI